MRKNVKFQNMFLYSYRGIDGRKSTEKPNPEEFVRYIVDTNDKIGPQSLDCHLRPMWASCPFCSVEFDVIGNLNTFDQDSMFIMKSLNMTVNYEVMWKNSALLAIDCS